MSSRRAAAGEPGAPRARRERIPEAVIASDRAAAPARGEHRHTSEKPYGSTGYLKTAADKASHAKTIIDNLFPITTVIASKIVSGIRVLHPLI